MPRYTTDDLAAALRDTRGMVFLAAKRLGCSPQTMQARLRQSKELQAVREAAEGEQLDTTELKLFARIQNDELDAIKFYLRTKGRQRGYVERTETDHRGSVEHRHGFDPAALEGAARAYVAGLRDSRALPASVGDGGGADRPPAPGGDSL